MIKATRVRLYPSEKQKVLLEKHFGSCRFVWNHFLEVRTGYYAEHRDDKKKGLTGFDTMKMLTVLKKEIIWLNEINSEPPAFPCEAGYGIQVILQTQYGLSHIQVKEG